MAQPYGDHVRIARQSLRKRFVRVELEYEEDQHYEAAIPDVPNTKSCRPCEVKEWMGLDSRTWHLHFR